jgi:hypothetical protein
MADTGKRTILSTFHEFSPNLAVSDRREQADEQRIWWMRLR